MLMIADVGNASLCNGTRLQWYQNAFIEKTACATAHTVNLIAVCFISSALALMCYYAETCLLTV